MKRNGFTLIELLAVIVILAIIALIATPIILGIINDAREKSEKRSVELYASAVRNGIAAYQLSGKVVAANTYDEKTLPFEVEYEGTVVCDIIRIYSDGNVYLEGCKVNNGDKKYNYGTNQESIVEKVCTRQNDEEEFDTVTCTIGENIESFYVMNSYLTDVPSEKIVMMTKYNIDPTTYRQSETAGAVAFSSTNYWVDENNNLLPQYETYTADVYDSNSLLYLIVEGYVSYLNGSLIENVTGSLLTYNQAEKLGCSGSRNSCSSAPKWVYSTDYWTGSASDTNYMWDIHSNNWFADDEDYDYNNHIGVRPVITISTSDIK